VTGPGRERFVDVESVDVRGGNTILVVGDDGRLVSDKLSSLREMRWLILV